VRSVPFSFGPAVSLLAVLLLAVLPLDGCSLPGQAPWTGHLEAAAGRWQARQVRAYRISVLKVQSIFHAQTNTVAVEDNRIAQQSAFCTPAPFEGRECQVQPFDANEFTVDGLFATARTLAQSKSSAALKITFDEQYHYPAVISIDTPEIVDDETLWRVVAFQLLP
jgi:hypothetical protein